MTSDATINEWDDSIQAPAPCQPIGCDNGYHLPGCYYADADEQAAEEHRAWLDEQAAKHCIAFDRDEDSIFGHCVCGHSIYEHEGTLGPCAAARLAAESTEEA